MWLNRQITSAAKPPSHRRASRMSRSKQAGRRAFSRPMLPNRRMSAPRHGCTSSTTRKTGNSFSVRMADEFERRLGEADVVVVSGLWRNELLEKAHRLRFIQSIGAGTDQFDLENLKRRGIP